MSSSLVVLLAIVVVAGMLLWLGALADAADLPPEAHTAVSRTKRSTLVFVGLTFVLGGVWYWAFIRAGVRRAAGGPGISGGF